jgi:hypothetical protein
MKKSEIALLVSFPLRGRSVIRGKKGKKCNIERD